MIPDSAIARVSLALALSLLLHAAMMFSPLVELPKSEVPLPPLTAKLEPLPATATPAPKKKPRPKPAKPPVPPQPQEASPETAAEEAPVVAEPPPEVAGEAEAQPSHPLPRQAQLTFTAYQGSGGMQLGEAIHRLDIDEEGQYTLTAVTQTTGLASVFKTYVLTQTSTGRIDAQGLQPHSFSEEKKLSKGGENLSAEFDWAAHKLRFSHGGETGLPEQAQDILSFLYQLSQLPGNREVQPLHISNGKKLEYYELEIGEEEEITTPLGKLRALPLRKVHAQNEEGLDIWLGLEYRLLPVKIRQIERSGQIAGEMVISDIRVAEESPAQGLK